MANLIGQQRGNFKLTKLLGQGGFAEVYLGENIYAQNNKVAIKILNAHLDEKGIQQFRGEANTLTSLKHPHIIQVTDFGFDNTIPYLIMEYAPNDSLANRHPIGKPLPITIVAHYIKQVADALQYAHNHNIIHRDVKPANVLIGANNSILLSDFGIARVVQTYTVGTKSIVGSFEYMSPEQGKGGAGAVFASDQYSLAVVAYQWLCGNLPFQGDTAQLIAQHRMDLPPPFPTTLNISASVASVIMKALAKDPQQRFANVQEFASTLEQASTGVEGGTLTTQTQLSVNKNIDGLYRQGVVAYASGEASQNKKDFFEEAEHCWEQVLTLDPNYLNGSLKTRFTKLQDQLGPLRIQELRGLAENHRKTGQWQEAIQSWEVLLRLAPKDAEAQRSIVTARHNMQYVGMYATARQLVQEGNLLAAKAELAALKTYAPGYNDPENLTGTIQQKEEEIERPKREAAAKAAQERVAKATQERVAKAAQEEADKKAKSAIDGNMIFTVASATALLWSVSVVLGIVAHSLTLIVIIDVIIAIISGIRFIILFMKPHSTIDSDEIFLYIGAPVIAIVLAALIVWGVTATNQTWLSVVVCVVFGAIGLLGIGSFILTFL